MDAAGDGELVHLLVSIGKQTYHNVHVTAMPLIEALVVTTSRQ